MRNFLIKLGLNAVALWLTTLVYSQGVYFERSGQTWDVLVAALVLGIVNALIRPVLLLFSLPINVLTLGLFTLVVNGVVLSIVAWATSLDVRNFGAAIIGALILSVISWILDTVLHTLDGKQDA
ncbi:phage holin family protein [Deinococcus sp. KNUC1210]|uniref:phage holin family protein n=1 Tax=Deinococcus sp. KNUC1210 TaxID=2917691 RepID=UPI001EEFBB43|nr:phage holin family protein [Deinococcus sp. KNUC1210]ULH15660.1 phage holin family protein [Deinococcus sp. KNUC1210]